MTYAPTEADFDVGVAGARARGIDPLDVFELLWIESAGFNPASLGPSNDGAVSGLNQMSRANLASLGLTPDQWTAMSAAAQFQQIFPFWDSLAKSFNARHFPVDGPNLLALNFLPSRYQSSGAAANPDAALSTKGDAYYAANTFYDPAKTGAITVNTIRNRFASQRAAGGARWALLANGVAAALARAGAAPAPVAPPSTPAAPSSPGSTPASSSSSNTETMIQAGFGGLAIVALIVSAIAAALRSR